MLEAQKQVNDITATKEPESMDPNADLDLDLFQVSNVFGMVGLLSCLQPDTPRISQVSRPPTGPMAR